MFELPGTDVHELILTEEDVKEKLAKRYKNIKIEDDKKS